MYLFFYTKSKRCNKLRMSEHHADRDGVVGDDKIQIGKIIASASTTEQKSSSAIIDEKTKSITTTTTTLTTVKQNKILPKRRNFRFYDKIYYNF